MVLETTTLPVELRPYDRYAPKGEGGGRTRTSNIGDHYSTIELLRQVGRLRGHACQRDAGMHCYCTPGYVHGVRFRLPITKNKRTFVETGLIPRNDRTAASGPRPRCYYYSTPGLPYGATKVSRMCYSFSVIHNHCVFCVNNSMGMGMSPGPSIMSAIRLRMWSMRRRQ